jgi:hypothetical protein
MPTTQPGRRYPFRSRVRCNACQHRMHGLWRPSPTKNNPHGTNIYYRCPYSPNNPRHALASPDHPVASISVREEALVTAVNGFLDQYVLGHGRAANLAALIPVTADDQAAQRQARARTLHAELAKIDTAQASLITELEQLAADTSPATTAYRARIRARNAELHDQLTRAQIQLTALDDQPPANDPTLLDELPYLPGILAKAPDAVKEKLLAALDVQCLYRKKQHQATIFVTITDTTPATLAALLADPRTDDNEPGPQPADPAPSGVLEQGPITHFMYRDHGTVSDERAGIRG